jgi:NADPH-dependent 2,4-dienoyl-CoA reductase/sulfur reductase-like enzyme
MTKKVIIIGGVAAGMSCAAKLSREDENAQITVYEKGQHISYGACGLPYYIGDVMDDPMKLIVKKPEDFKNTKVSVKIHHQVLKVDPDKKTVTVRKVNTDEEFVDQYDKLVIASGAEPVMPPFAQEKIRNVFTLRTVEDGEVIKATALSDDIKKVVLIGAGYIGLELVESFYNLKKDITLVNRSSNIMKPVDQEIRDLLIEELKEKNIGLHFNNEVKEITKDSTGKVKSVLTDNGEFEADLVVIAIGVAPATAFVKDLGFETLDNGAIITNNKMETNLPDIYAIGDCGTIYHRVLKKHVNIPLATYANKQGRRLGEILAGKDKTFPGGIGTSIVKILDLTISATGINETQAKENKFNYNTQFIKSYSHAGYFPDSTDLYIKLIFDKETKILLGGQVTGKKGAKHRINALAIAIQNEMTLDEFAYSDFAYTPTQSGPWDPTQIAANVAD